MKRLQQMTMKNSSFTGGVSENSFELVKIDREVNHYEIAKIDREGNHYEMFHNHCNYLILLVSHTPVK